MEQIQDEMSEETDKSIDIKRFISIISKMKEPEVITDEMLSDLVDKIVVHEAERNRSFSRAWGALLSSA